jgi:hypothetical protein
MRTASWMGQRWSTVDCSPGGRSSPRRAGVHGPVPKRRLLASEPSDYSKSCRTETCPASRAHRSQDEEETIEDSTAIGITLDRLGQKA